ncbi:I78 family peptidase inhibitor [Albibacillus kandeliae]|uniref:I78 family peptidase inhibitor n=1 Tax=Albibacillus kandeliae TaxID=2174228 RepID=UPI000D697E89|nr:I78 family peptidase inhibitor [Albibacillus kandeliae]
MRVTWMIAGLALASTLAACGDAPSRTERSSPAMSTADGNEACLNSAQKGLVGKPFDQSRPLLPADVRVIPADSVYTQDFRPSRVNVNVNNAYTITRVWCG